MQKWLEANFWLVEITAVAAAAVGALMLWATLRRKLLSHSEKSAMPWDDILVKALGAPVLALIGLLSLHYVFGVAAVQLLGQELGGKHSYALLRDVVVVAAVFWILLRIVNGIETFIRRRQIKVGEKEISHGTVQLIFQSARAVIFLIVALIIMDAFGFSISGLLAFGGVGSILVGFAAKDTLTNFFSGLLIFWERPFSVGDWVRRPDANIEGVVESIGWRMTQIRTFDQRPLYVPNSLFFNSVIENPTRMTNRRIYEYIGLRYQDIEKLPAVLADVRAMLDAHADIDQEQLKMVYFDKYGASSLDLFIYVMTKTVAWKEFHIVKEDVLLKIAAIVHKHGCDFAFPTRTVHHHMSEGTPPPLPH